MARRRATHAWVALALVCSVTVTGIGVGTDRAEADVTAVTGSACGYFTNVSLFSGPFNRRGCGQPAEAPASNASPSVTLPAAGSATPITASDPDGAVGEYGPARIFSGQYPNLANDPTGSSGSPPSGPQQVSVQGTLGPGGSVTSSASILPGTQGTADPNQPRGVGPGPFFADAVSSTCSAQETDPATGARSLSGTTTITNGTSRRSTTWGPSCRP